MRRVLIIDNFDSFTWNLVEEFRRRSCETMVYRASTAIEELVSVASSKAVGLVVISPGPGSPAQSGCSLAAVRAFEGSVPLFGVCLGLQCMTEAFGGEVGRAPAPLHGKASLVRHDGRDMFQEVENPLLVARYHSLCALRVPDCLEVAARSDDGVVMALRHRMALMWGVQFHPESVLTPAGGVILDNVLRLALGCPAGLSGVAGAGAGA